MRIIKTANDYVVIYRAVPAFVNEFRHMDYVTKSKRWAIGHAEHVAVMEEDSAIVLRALVKSSEIEEAYNPGEYRYIGEGLVGEEIHRVEADENN